MKRRRNLGSSILVFVLAQTAWTCLLGLWIAWYVTNTISLRSAARVLTAPLVIQGFNLATLVVGLFLLGALLIGVTLIFTWLVQQVQLNRVYDDFIGSVTHELKTPLASVRLHLETLNRLEIAGPVRERLQGYMLGDIERLERLVTTILGVSRIETRKVRQSFDPVAAADLFPALVVRSARDFKIPDEALEVTGAVRGFLRADSGLLRTVVETLLDNAVKYSEQAPRLRLELSSSRRAAVIELSDNGIGIPKNDLNRVFSKFFRVSRPDSPVVTGTGLGLYWAREIIEMHRGRIRMLPRRPGSGSTVRIELPLMRTPPHLTTEDRA